MCLYTRYKSTKLILPYPVAQYIFALFTLFISLLALEEALVNFIHASIASFFICSLVFPFIKNSTKSSALAGGAGHFLKAYFFCEIFFKKN